MNINCNLIKKLRLKTGSGIMDCKKALLHSSGNLEKAIVYLRKNGILKAEKKSLNVALHGVILSKIKNNFGYLIEVNCETDFVAQHEEFIYFAKEVLKQLCIQNIKDINHLRHVCNNKRIDLISKFNENIIIRRYYILQGCFITSYIHGFRIGVLLDTQCSQNSTLMKQIAMHIAASKPDFLHSDDIPISVIKNERQIQLDIVKQSGKSDLISKKIVDGKMKKFINNVVLYEQNFIIDPNKKMKDFLLENNIKILKFIRFELGEII
ncbi:translation elongation factor Ts [Buchnera aphidicola]|uniref:Elongation factor Ts n=1 Tax=Buchnera aphidicola (Stegophylla sp.) TaxID=2315800 RepID=A0A4D6YK63_9GAMM|nr:translation elongation factor Ts [Buchnera aphidicola (Stegophylla sp.)]QCI26334.1 elongation factor Ts [Buchnera aphidicola (Stegophylla sp.)]